MVSAYKLKMIPAEEILIISSKKNFMTDRGLHQICNKKHFLSRSRLEEISLSETNLITVV